MESAWMDDVPLFSDKTVEIIYHYKMDKRREMLNNSTADIIVVNYEVIEKLYPEIVKKGFDMCVLDESTFIKNPTSKRTKAVLKLSKHIPNRFIATATPGKSPERYWSQWAFIDPETWDGKSFWKFRDKYFFEIKLPTGMSIWKYNINHDNEIRERMYRNGIRLTKDECAPYLPEKIFELRIVDLPTKAMSAYNKMKKDSYIDDYDLAAFFSHTNRIKLKQIANGWVIDDERGRERSVHQIHSEKINETEVIIDSLPENEPVIIWANYKEEIDALHKKFGFPTVCGSSKNPLQVISDFKKGKLRGVIAHPQSVAHGVTWTICSHVIFFGLPDDVELFSQAMDRVHRHGQKNIVNYFIILSRNTIDMRLWENHKLSKAQEDRIHQSNYQQRNILIAIGEI